MNTRPVDQATEMHLEKRFKIHIRITNSMSRARRDRQRNSFDSTITLEANCDSKLESLIEGTVYHSPVRCKQINELNKKKIEERLKYP